MVEIEDILISDDILTERFCCDLSRCKGMCCVEGNSGAPLEPEEVDILAKEYRSFKKFMTPEGIEAVEHQGFAVTDSDGDLVTPLVGQAECAYTYTADGVTLCAIERAFKEGLTAFQKPISCHLYPIRVLRFSDGSLALNYHKWDVCGGCTGGEPVYKMLREAIVRRFGKDFYEALETLS